MIDYRIINSTTSSDCYQIYCYTLSAWCLLQEDVDKVHKKLEDILGIDVEVIYSPEFINTKLGLKRKVRYSFLIKDCESDKCKERLEKLLFEMRLKYRNVTLEISGIPYHLYS